MFALNHSLSQSGQAIYCLRNIGTHHRSTLDSNYALNFQWNRWQLIVCYRVRVQSELLLHIAREFNHNFSTSSSFSNKRKNLAQMSQVNHAQESKGRFGKDREYTEEK